MPIARVAAFTFTSVLCRAFMYYLNDLEIKHDSRYDDLITAVTQRPDGQALITYGNHRSVLDDPVLAACFLPFHLTVQPKFARWNICTQDICFQPEADLLHSYFGAGKAMPMWRGGGIDQKLLLDFQRRVSAGDWCQIFPEAGCWQYEDGGLGGREGPRGDELGKLKWGIGKLIAHAPTRPKVIPFFHTGMEGVMPQHPVTRDLLTSLPCTGNSVTLRFGDAVSFDDILDEHEAKYGPIRKHPHIATEEDKTDFLKSWASTPEERQLYSKLTKRMEEALEQLRFESRWDLETKEKTGKMLPGKPPVGWKETPVVRVSSIMLAEAKAAADLAAAGMTLTSVATETAASATPSAPTKA